MQVRFIGIAILYIFLLACTFTESSTDPTIGLTTAEMEYIRNTNVLWSPEEHYPPFISVEDSSAPYGLSVDYLHLISQKTGLRFITLSKGCQLVDCLNDVKNGTSHMVTSVRSTPERSKYLRFTRPYYFVGTVIIKSSISPNLTAIGKGFAIKEYLQKNNPTMKLKEFNTDEESVIAMIAGVVDSVILDEVSQHILRKKYNYNFDQQIIPHDYPLSFAVGKDNVVLASILNKAISHITEAEKEEISKKWKLK